MSRYKEIFVRLLGEGDDVWRPIAAQHIDGDVYRIAEQPYDRDAEKWQFEPGADVVCQVVESKDGLMLAAVRRNEPG